MLATFVQNHFMLTNFHSHTRFSDGSAEPADYAENAVRMGLRAYGYSCHAPIPFAQNWCMRPENLEKYFTTIADLKARFKDRIELYAGLEIDYIPGHSSVSHFKNLDGTLDYTISSVHYVDYFPDGTPCNIDGRPDEFSQGLEHIWGRDIRVAVKRYFGLVREMLQNSSPDIVGHIDKIRFHNESNRLFDPAEDWYVREMKDTLILLKQSGCLMEINTRSIYKRGFAEPYPSREFIACAAKMRIPVIVNSDAHKPSELVAGFPEAISLLRACGIRSQMILIGNHWQEVELEDV
jgi:histidinol-phosphatase (PHP family)